MIEPYAARVPLLAGVGNHEIDVDGVGWHPSWGNMGDDSHGECGVPSKARFHMPETGNGMLWYSVDQGPVHLTMMSSEHNFTRGSEQYKWLAADLASVDRAVTPWVVLGGHRPMYTSETNSDSDHTVSLHLQAELEDLLYAHKVNLMFTGHYHAYERTHPVLKQKRVADGRATVHAMVGSGGASLDENPYEPTEWSAAHINEYGISVIEADGTSFRVQQWLNNGTLFDEFELLPWW